MMRSDKYSGALTAEQFLFHEMRIVAKKYLEKQLIEKIISEVKKDNLFQYPTERQVSRMVRACFKRANLLDNDKLVAEIINTPTEVAKQINLYSIMRYNRLVWEFMVDVVGEKYRQNDDTLTVKDINEFFTRLQEQNDSVASWSEATIKKLSQVLRKCLVEVEILDSSKSTKLNPILISTELEEGMRENHDEVAFSAFNYFPRS
ncbi:DUF1819 family protein [Lactococcus petauri]|uniref:DUF1819 family protein n=1 Tax=Lactococcus petauri TaxID=1940789 RepID=UPI00177BADF3|nr:DUF1819 family protein [Lactococcus petauri]MBD5823472.1 DUF1819 family protein [Lactococcus petauri]